ncbi:hypothetical protein [Halonotius terrestris]|uniref:hypothetical protein n=1 Tax=Halonotius terrestris TaxID=2487750 RepID=UPI001C8EA4F1|nr:hypothetical protein [Halonotius terrestris]
MSEADPITRIELADVQTKTGDYHDVGVEIYPSWVMIEDDTGIRWIARDTVTEIFERE